MDMRRKTLLATFAGLLLLACATLSLTSNPAVAAVACPSCFGFERIEPGLYAEAGLSPDVQSRLRAAVDEGRDRVRHFYGRLDSNPEVFVCASDDCYRPVGGSSRGLAILDRALFLSPRGANVVIAAHEMAHIELHARIGLVNTIRRAIPQWFDEGLAVYVSDDRRYLAPPTSADRCLVASDEALPTERSKWIETAASHDLYAKAACRVSRWVRRKGGARAVVGLAERVAAGESFQSALR